MTLAYDKRSCIEIVGDAQTEGSGEETHTKGSDSEGVGDAQIRATREEIGRFEGERGAQEGEEAQSRLFHISLGIHEGLLYPKETTYSLGYSRSQRSVSSPRGP